VPNNPTKPIFFCLHRVSDEYSPAYPPLKVKAFERLCKYLMHHYSVVSLAQLSSEEKFDKRPVILTFDDAYFDFYENVVPILNKFNIPAVQHVITSCATTGESFWTQKLNKLIERYAEMNKPLLMNGQKFMIQNNANDIGRKALEIFKTLLHDTNPEQVIEELSAAIAYDVEFTKMMSWEQLKKASGENVEIGSHTVNHLNINCLTNEEIQFEMQFSFEEIKSRIGKQSKSISFPNGQFNEFAVETGKKIGYEFMFETDQFNHSGTHNLYSREVFYYASFWKNLLRHNYNQLKNKG
jgi:peptidoglycan/xylan/chitin deacetylase (PgdA/CDA1 family)